MELLSILLVAFSAVLHGSWNLIGRSSGGGIHRFFLANLYGTLLLVPLIVLNFSILRTFPPAIWGFLVLTGFFQAAYFLGLSLAYRRGSISKTYPIVRSAPIILISLYMVLCGRGAELSVVYWISVFLISLGIVLKSFGSERGPAGGRRIGGISGPSSSSPSSPRGPPDTPWSTREFFTASGRSFIS